ncbi:hypothetical protein X976_5210 [Burkholderia pseudomallei MSHR7500]|nr:hypothetical protein X976_5210 [Burkholderia pseudomallei MSHR7500]
MLLCGLLERSLTEPGGGHENFARRASGPPRPRRALRRDASAFAKTRMLRRRITAKSMSEAASGPVRRRRGAAGPTRRAARCAAGAGQPGRRGGRPRARQAPARGCRGAGVSRPPPDQTSPVR